MSYPKKLLDTSTGNTKIRKTQNSEEAVRVASLSMMPDPVLCPWSKAAGCFDVCLKSSGRGRFDNVANGRQRKSEYYHENENAFMDQLRRELFNFEKVCNRDNVQPAARLNVISDVAWERHEIPQQFPNIFFYDYTKTAHRLGKTPENYKLMFSYSGAPKYQDSVKTALKTDVPVAVVFNEIPTNPNFTFLDRRIINGDKSDLLNVRAGPVVVALKYKRTNATARDIARSDFVVIASAA